MSVKTIKYLQWHTEEAPTHGGAPGPPFRNLSRVGKMVENLQPRGYLAFYPKETWTPNVNLYETEEHYLICVDLSGVEKKKIDIELVDQKVILKGSRQIPAVPRAAGPRSRFVRVHLMEIDHGAFARQIDLPDNVARDKINAHYVDGMLWVELPKKG
jgi:HSP20 family molecular chaperone IbpA